MINLPKRVGRKIKNINEYQKSIKNITVKCNLTILSISSGLHNKTFHYKRKQKNISKSGELTNFYVILYFFNGIMKFFYEILKLKKKKKKSKEKMTSLIKKEE